MSKEHAADCRASAADGGWIEVLPGETDVATTLAGVRTLLAAERTYAAWMRTALTALASGVGARALLDNVVPEWLARLTGSVLVLFAGFCLVAAVWREVGRDIAQAKLGLRPLPHRLLLAVNAFLLVVALAAFVGLWAA